MIIHWTILIGSYLLASLWLLFPENIVGENGIVAKRPSFPIVFLSFSLLILFCGLRSSMLDTAAYINQFNNLSEEFFIALKATRDEGFTIFTYILKYFIYNDFHLWLFIISLISCLAIMIPLYKYSLMFELSVFLFIATTQYTWLINGMRQYIPISIMFLCMGLLLEKKYFKYIAVCLLVSTFHASVLLVLPLLLIATQKPFSKWILASIMVTIVVFITIDTFIPLMGNLLVNTQYEGYDKEIIKYQASSINRLVVALMPIMFVIFKYKRVKELNDKVLNLCINMSIFNILFMLLATAIGGIFLGRLAGYFEIYNLLLYPLILKKVLTSQFKIIIYIGIIILYTIWFYYQMEVTWNMYYISDILDIYEVNYK